MRRRQFIYLGTGLALGLLGCGQRSPSLVALATASPVQETLPTMTAGPSATATAIPTATATASPTATPTSEPTKTPEPTNVPKPEGMNQLGVEMVAQMVYSGEPRNRWEYKGVAYWDEKRGRLELDAGTTSLDFAEDKDLFVKLDAATVEEMVVASGYTAMPIPLDVDSGVMYEIFRGTLKSVDFNKVEGVAIMAPFSGRVFKVGEKINGVSYEKLVFYLKSESGVEVWMDTLYEGDLPSEVTAGQVITVIGQKELPYSGSNQADFDIWSMDKDTTLASLLTDSLGRKVMIKH